MWSSIKAGALPRPTCARSEFGNRPRTPTAQSANLRCRTKPREHIGSPFLCSARQGILTARGLPRNPRRGPPGRRVQRRLRGRAACQARAPFTRSCFLRWRWCCRSWGRGLPERKFQVQSSRFKVRRDNDGGNGEQGTGNGQRERKAGNRDSGFGDPPFGRC